MTSKIEDYKIVTANTADEFEQNVKTGIIRGYQPYGSPSILILEASNGNKSLGFYQAMVKHEVDKPENIPYRPYKFT